MWHICGNEHLGYDKYERSSEPNYRNGTKTKLVRSKYDEFDIGVLQDRQSTFEPKVVKKRQKDISAIDDKIISMYAKGMSTRQISDAIEDIYGFEVSEGMISDITDKLIPEIENWQNRPLSSVYPVVFIDAVHFSVRDDGIIRKLAAYIVLGINDEGKKEFATDLKTIYTAPDEKTGLKQLEAVTQKWDEHYPNAMKRWIDRAL